MQNRPSGAAPMIPPEQADFPLIAAGPHHMDDHANHAGHWHQELELGWCACGQGCFTVAGKQLPFRGGDVAVINRHELHFAGSVPGTTSIWHYIFVDTSALLGDWIDDRQLLAVEALCGPDFVNVVGPDQAPTLCALLPRLLEELRQRRTGWRWAARGLMLAILAACQRLPGRDRHRDQRSLSALRTIRPALELLHARFHEALRIDDLAAACACSSSTLHRQFLLAVGRPAQDYLLGLRVQRAADLLRHSDRSIANIAGAVGFSNASSLYRQFTARRGCSPEAWRRG